MGDVIHIQLFQQREGACSRAFTCYFICFSQQTNGRRYPFFKKSSFFSDEPQRAHDLPKVTQLIRAGPELRSYYKVLSTIPCS